jgi:hypothetical protein
MKNLLLASRDTLMRKTFNNIEDLPTGMQYIIIQPFDKLTSPEQVLLKAVSVVGMRFAVEVLHYTLNRFGAVL